MSGREDVAAARSEAEGDTGETKEAIGPAGARPISVVVTTHQRVERLRRLVERLLQEAAVFELVVVADGCTDGTVEYLTTLARGEQRLRPVILHSNAGPAAARLAGFRQARCDVVLSLDDDVDPAAGLVAGHAAHHDGRPLLVVGHMPTVVPDPRRRGDFATVGYAEEYDRHVRLWERQPDDLFRHFWAGNFSCPRVAYLRAAAGVDLSLRYHEDTDLGRRLGEQSMTAVFDRGLRAAHEHRRDWSACMHEAERKAEARLRLTARWVDEAPFDLESLSRETRAGGRLVRLVGRSARAVRTLSAVLRAVNLIAGSLRLWDLERRAAHLAMILRMADVLRRQDEKAAARSRRRIPAGLGISGGVGSAAAGFSVVRDAGAALAQQWRVMGPRALVPPVPRRAVGDALAQLEPLRALRERLLGKSPCPPVGLAMVYRSRNLNHVLKLLRQTEQDISVALWSLDEVPEELAPWTVGVGAGQRLPLLNRAVAAMELPADAWLMISDDDVALERARVEDVVRLAQLAGFDVAQPTHGRRSPRSWPVNRHRPLSWARRTRFVETGPLLVFSPTARAACLPLPEHLGMGWGSEATWGTRLELDTGVLDAVTMRHMAAVGGGYDATQQQRLAEEEYAALLPKAGFASLEDLQRERGRWWLWQQSPRWAPPGQA
jgi:GT2 family glycosyltransferase